MSLGLGLLLLLERVFVREGGAGGAQVLPALQELSLSLAAVDARAKGRGGGFGG